LKEKEMKARVTQDFVASFEDATLQPKANDILEDPFASFCVSNGLPVEKVDEAAAPEVTPEAASAAPVESAPEAASPAPDPSVQPTPAAPIVSESLAAPVEQPQIEV
jgi:hypothetical protein